MLATLGDLVDDLVIRVDDPVNVASDTEAHIERRRGGSAANVAAAAARLGHPTRFLGQVGAGELGDLLVAELAAVGVDVAHVRRGGRPATIAVLVDGSGERTMLSDRGACADLADPDPSWLDGVSTLHVPLYTFTAGPLATTGRTIAGWCHERGIPVSIDVSSVAAIEAIGRGAVETLLRDLRAALVFANADEARTMSIAGPMAGAVTVVKRGPDPVVVHTTAGRSEVPTEPVEAADTTGAGDAFAAGFLVADWPVDPVAAARAGHASALATLRSAGGGDGRPSD